MAKARERFWFGNNIILLLSPVFFLGTFLFFQNKLSSVKQNSLEEQTLIGISTPTFGSYPKDEVENGIYTNYKHKFSLKYPEEIFTKFNTNHTWNTSTLETYDNPEKMTDQDASMWITVYDNSSTEIKDEQSIFEFRYMLSPGWQGESNNRFKITSKDDFGNYRRVILENDSSDITREKGYGYSAMFYKNNEPVIEIALSLASKNAKSKFGPIFDKIVDSFKFFNEKEE